MIGKKLFYIKIRNQTTTIPPIKFEEAVLFYIKIRNQTTTINSQAALTEILFYIKIRNQTTTEIVNTLFSINYFTSKLEIKPQLVFIA